MAVVSHRSDVYVESLSVGLVRRNLVPVCLADVADAEPRTMRVSALPLQGDGDDPLDGRSETELVYAARIPVGVEAVPVDGQLRGKAVACCAAAHAEGLLHPRPGLRSEDPIGMKPTAACQRATASVKSCSLGEAFSGSPTRWSGFTLYEQDDDAITSAVCDLLLEQAG